MRALEYKTGHVIYNPAYAYKFQLKTTLIYIYADIVGGSEEVQNYAGIIYGWSHPYLLNLNLNLFFFQKCVDTWPKI